MISIRLLSVVVCLNCLVLGAVEPVPVQSLPPIAAKGDAMFEVKLKAGVNGMNMVVLLRAEQDRWQRVWGYHYGFGNGLCHGYVTAAEVTPQKARWDLVLHIPGDLLNKQALFGRFVITAERNGPDAPWTATYESRVTGGPLAHGEAVVTTLPLPPRRAGATPIAVGEHPRLLFRKSDIPALRQRLATPFGQAALTALAASGDPAALGVLYQITGDRKYADQARAPFETELAKEDFGMLGIGQIWASRLLTVSVAWDCLRELWDEEFNRKVDEVLLARCELLFFNSGGNMAATSNWAGPRNAGAGMATLVLAGDPGEGPPPLGSLNGPTTRLGFRYHPIRQNIYRSDQPLVIEMPPLAGKTGPEWSLGKPFPAWIWSGLIAIEFKGTQDLLAGLGGSAKAMPEEGTTCTSTIYTADGENEIAVRFSKMPENLFGKDGLTASSLLAGGTAAGNTVLSTMFQVGADMSVRCANPPKGVSLWLDQSSVKAGQIYLLKPGTHRMLVSISFATNALPSGRLDPQFVDASQELVPLQEAIRLFGAHERGDWEAKGRPDFNKDYLVDVGRMTHYQYCWLGMGDGGFQAESGHYSHAGGGGTFPYALMHWNVFGRLVSGRGDAARYVPRHVFSNPVGEPYPNFYHRGSRLLGLAIHGVNYPCGNAYAGSFPFLNPAWQPAVLWLWQQDLGIDPAKPETAIKKSPDCITFLTYPLDLTAAPPSTPAWPLTWASRYRGWYGFRNGYRGASQDALVQVCAKASSEMGWNHPNAGAIAVQAFGQPWAVSVDSREGYRFQESVVQLLAIANSGGGYGVVRDYRTETDGSGSLSIDMRNVYREPSDEPGQRFIDKNGMFAPGVPEPGGPIAKGRFLAVDYCGRAGCPVVLVIVDRLDGLKGIKRHWQWMLPKQLHAAATYDARSFTVATTSATLRATFAHPANPDFKRPGEVFVTATTRSKEKKEATPGTEAGVAGLTGEIVGIDPKKKKEQLAKDATKEHPLEGIGAQGDDHFFVVLTIGPGTPPAVEVQGSGLDAVVKVGGRIYRFDGTRVVMADAPAPAP
jgi:hypothetical protein